MAYLVSDVINRAFITMGSIAPGETVPSVPQADAFLVLNSLIDMLSAEGLTVPNQVMQTFALAQNTGSYTLGPGGSFATSGGLRAMKVTSWNARFLDMQRGGPALAMDLFSRQAADIQRAMVGANITALMSSMDAAARAFLAAPVPPIQIEIQNTLTQMIGAIPNTVTAPIPTVLGADTGVPLVNVRISPPPGATPGQIELAYWTPLSNFATVSDPITLPAGWFVLLYTQLAKLLSPTYGKPSMIQAVWKLADNAKQALLQENVMPEEPSQPTTLEATPPIQVQAKQ